MPHMLIAGHVTHDLVAGGVLPGGSAYYSAQTWRRLGARARVVTCVGEDFVAEEAFAGVETQVSRAGRTTVFRNHYPPGQARVQWVEATAAPVDSAALPEDWRAPAVALLAPVLGELDLADWTARLAARWLAIAVQGWVREAVPEPGGRRRVRPRRWSPTPEALAGVQVALVSDEDLAGQGELLERLVAHVPIVACTFGDRGCAIHWEGRRVRVEAHPARTVDPTGAGDTFAAGFLLGLAEGARPDEAARLGAAAASIIVEAPGGAALDRMHEARGRLQPSPTKGMA